MKKIMGLLLGLSLVIGTATYAFAGQSTTKSTKKAKSTKAKTSTKTKS